MKQKIIFTIAFAIVMLNALTQGANITVSGEYRLDINENTTTSTLSQDSEYNLSSYMDYIEATSDLLLNKQMNFTSGVVFHSLTHDLTAYSPDTGLSSYYWAIAALSKMYSMSNNDTFKIAMSRAAITMVSLFLDPTYTGYYLNQYSDAELRQTKRPGVQAYAYWALDIAESTNASLDFTMEKESALRCLTDMLYDPVYGGFHFYTMRNGSLEVPTNFDEVYPNDGKRLDHLALAATALYDAGTSLGNATMVNIAESAMSFMISYMKYYHEMEFIGLKLAVNRTGTTVVVTPGDRVAHSIVTDINAIAIRALVKGYGTTGNATYLEFANEVFEALFANNWDGESGGWFAETVDGEPYDPLEDEDVKYYKYSEIQFLIILALEDLYEATDSIYPVRLIFDTYELVLANLWDLADEGFVSNSNQIWEVFNPEWEVHYTTVQAQGVVSLSRIWNYGLPIVSRVRINPTNPRPDDSVYFSVQALDTDGIDFVYVNYTLTDGGNETNGILPLPAHPSIGGLFNSTMGTLEDDTSVNFEIVANDTTGRTFVAGLYHFVVRVDTFAPIVQLHNIYPDGTIRSGDDIVIDIESTEFPVQSHTNTCELVWRTLDTAYVRENMTAIQAIDDTIIWRLALGKFDGGEQISFFCQVMDEAGNVGESRMYSLTVLSPVITISPIATFQVVAVVGLLAAPGVGYVYAQRKKGRYREAQREGKKDAKRRARQRGTSRRRRQNKGE